MDVKNKNLKEMCVLDTFEKLGVWWPYDTENSVTGRIKYDKGHITLHIMLPLDIADHMDTLAKILPNDNPERFNTSLPQLEYVKGILENGERVLLNNCMFVESHIANGVCSKSYRASHMFAGNVNPEIDMRGDKISIQYTSLYTWLCPKTIHNVKTVLTDYNMETSFTHGSPKNLRIKLSDDDFLEINYFCNMPFHIVIKNFTISQSASVALKSKKTLDLESLYDKILPFRNFLILATDTRIQPESIHMHRNNDFFVVFWDLKLYEDIDEEQDIFKMNFNYQQIKGNFEKIIRHWFEYYAKYKKALDLYFSSKLDGPHLPINIIFLRIVQSLETLHRIKNSKEIEFKERLEDLAKGSHDIFNSYTKPDVFFQQVSDARHYLSHGYLKNKQDKMPSDAELIKITYTLDLLMFVCIIEDSELPEELKGNVLKNKIKRIHQIKIY